MVRVMQFHADRFSKYHLSLLRFVSSSYSSVILLSARVVNFQWQRCTCYHRPCRNASPPPVRPKVTDSALLKSREFLLAADIARMLFVVPMEQTMGWSRTDTNAALSLGLLVSGLAAYPSAHGLTMATAGKSWWQVPFARILDSAIVYCMSLFDFYRPL
jgi:hypothetical protein